MDDSCIDCGACQWIAPDTFDDAGQTARVHRQPTTELEIAAALRAQVSCPTASIGTHSRRDVAAAVASFPFPIAGEVLHCGFHSEASFGATSYLVVRDGGNGNVLVDSPRFTRPLVSRIEALGGIATMFLTHADDVADHARFRDHFGCERVIHADDVGSGTRSVERQISGADPVRLADDLLAIPTPGHTRGSMCLLYRDSVLFSGDHLAWDLEARRLYAFADACWYDWRAQTESMQRLAAHRFDHVLPGHGAPVALPPDEMAGALRDCIDRMRRTR